MKKGDRDVARHELIGLFVTVESRHAGWNGLEGTVVDETKQTLVVERASGSEGRADTRAREAVVPKTGQRFVFRVGNERFVVEGADIDFRPEDRTKKAR